MILVSLVVSQTEARADVPTIGIRFVEIDGPCLHILATTTIPGFNTRHGLYYGRDTTPADDRSTIRFAPGSSVGLDRSASTCDLAPSTRYYVQPFATDDMQIDEGRFACASVCSSCDFGFGVTPLTCDAIGEPPHFNTAAFNAVESPTAPVHAFDPVASPTIDGTSVTVSLNGSNECTDLQANLNSVAALDSDLNHEIQIPGGGVCRPESEGLSQYTLPARTGPGSGTGWVVIRTAGDSRLFPPQGVRTDPTYRPLLAVLQPNITGDGAYAWMGRLSTNRWIGAAAGANRFRFENLVFETPEVTDMPVRQAEIASVSVAGSTVTINLATPHLVAQQGVVQLNVPGIQGLQGVRRAIAFSSTSIRIIGQTISGTYTGGGTVTSALTHSITSCSNGVCTVPDHGLGNFEEYAITAIGGTDNNVLTISQVINQGTNYIVTDEVISISGSPGGTWDGIHLVTASTGTTITISGSFPSSCASGCGDYRESRPVQVFEVSGYPEVIGSHHFAVVDKDTLQLIGVASGSGTGGRLAFDPAMVFGFLDFSSNDPQNVVLDRIIIDPRGFPYRTAQVLSFVGAESVALINSFLMNGTFWMPIDPVSGVATRATLHDINVATARALTLTDGDDVQILNNAFWDYYGLVVMSDESPNGVNRHHTVERNTFYTSDRLIAGMADSDGRYHPGRHIYETKGSEFVALRGNFFSGSVVDVTPAGPAVVLSPRGVATFSQPRYTRDFLIQGNYFERVASAFQLAFEGNASLQTGPTRRIKISDNLVVADNLRMRSAPSNLGGPNEPFSFGGYFVHQDQPLADLVVERNTYYPPRAGGPETLLLSVGRSSRVAFSDNVLAYSKAIGNTINGVTTLQTGLAPECGILFGKDALNCMVQQEPGPGDPLSLFDSNVILPCIENSADEAGFIQNMLSAAPQDSIHLSEAQALYADIETSVPNEFVGSPLDDDSCAGRLDQLFEVGTFDVRPQYVGNGVDMQSLFDTMGRVDNVTVEDLTSTSVAIRYRAPDADACAVDYSTDTTFQSAPLITREGDGGGANDREVVLTGLTSGTQYAYRVQCAVHQPRGLFVTAN